MVGTARRAPLPTLRLCRRFVEQAVDALGLREAGDRKLAEISPAAGADAGEAFRGHDGAMEPAGDLFQPCRKIDRGPDAGEVEPVATADIAVKNFPHMQRDPA